MYYGEPRESGLFNGAGVGVAVSDVFVELSQQMHGRDSRWMHSYMRICQPFIAKQVWKLIRSKNLDKFKLLEEDATALCKIWRVAHRRWHAEKRRKDRRKR